MLYVWKRDIGTGARVILQHKANIVVSLVEYFTYCLYGLLSSVSGVFFGWLWLSLVEVSHLGVGTFEHFHLQALANVAVCSQTSQYGVLLPKNQTIFLQHSTVQFVLVTDTFAFCVRVFRLRLKVRHHRKSKNSLVIGIVLYFMLLLSTYSRFPSFQICNFYVINNYNCHIKRITWKFISNKKNLTIIIERNQSRSLFGMECGDCADPECSHPADGQRLFHFALCLRSCWLLVYVFDAS